MDPITAFGAVASALQLADMALSLSKGLYEVSSALSTAIEEINALAHDLALFSESLTLLSRMLEANQNRYSNVIYELSVKIMVDCGDICVKIESVLEKLKKWGLVNKIKWICGEKEKMKRLLDRLRDMKITLLMILSNLQLDQLLSQMNINSTSVIESQNNLKGDSLENDLAVELVEHERPSARMRRHSQLSTLRAPPQQNGLRGDAEQQDIGQVIQISQPLADSITLHTNPTPALCSDFVSSSTSSHNTLSSAPLQSPNNTDISMPTFCNVQRISSLASKTLTGNRQNPVRLPSSVDDWKPETDMNRSKLGTRSTEVFQQSVAVAKDTTSSFQSSNEDNQPLSIMNPSSDEMDNDLWPMDRVLQWLDLNHFSTDWQKTFKELSLEGPNFLALSAAAGGTGSALMHQVVYPRLAKECTASGTGWDQAREREEGRRMRKLICRVAKGKALYQANQTQGEEAIQVTEHQSLGRNHQVSFSALPEVRPKLSPARSHRESCFESLRHTRPLRSLKHACGAAASNSVTARHRARTSTSTRIVGSKVGRDFFDPMRILELEDPRYHSLVDDKESRQTFMMSPKPDRPRYPSSEQLSQLWWRGLVEWRRLSFSAVCKIEIQLQRLELVPTNATSNEDWNKQLKNFQETKISPIFSDLDDHLRQCSAVLKLVSENIGFRTASYAWASLASLIYQGGTTAISPESKFTLQLSTIVSIVARYTIMENIYHNWKSIALCQELEDRLIDLCIEILNYIAIAIRFLDSQGKTDPLLHLRSRTRQFLNAGYMKVLETDRKCRSFTIVLETNRREGRERATVGISD